MRHLEGNFEAGTKKPKVTFIFFTCEELLDHGVLLWTAPDYGLVLVGHQEPYAHHGEGLADGDRKPAFFALADLAVFHVEHLGHAGTAEINVLWANAAIKVYQLHLGV